MKNIFIPQLDYIYFVYGLSFMMLGAACLVQLKKRHIPLPWLWLALFGFSHGLSEWLHLCNIVFGNPKQVNDLNIFLTAASFFFLAEFGRRGILNMAGKGPGAWVHAPLILLAGLGGLAGIEGIDAASRYTLGTAGGLLACRAFMLAAKKQPRPSSLCFLWSAIFLGFYTFLTAAFVYYAPFPPASIINSALFFSVFGLPVQLVKGALATLTAMSLWIYSQNCYDPPEGAFRVRRLHSLIPAAILTGIIAAGWFLAGYLGNYAKQEEMTEAEIYIDAVASHLEKLPEAVVSKNIIIAENIFGSAQEGLKKHPNLFLVDRKGEILLTSNPDLISSKLWDSGEDSAATAAKDTKALFTGEPRNRTIVNSQNRDFLVTRRTLRESDWSLVLLSPVKQIKEYRLFSIFATLVMFCTAFLSFSVLQFTREAAAKTAASGQLYRSLVDGSPNFICLLDRDGRCLTANNAFLKILGYGLSDLSGRDLNSFCLVETGHGGITAFLKEALKGTRCSFESSLTGYNEKKIICSSTISPISDQDGQIRSFVCIFVDITAKKEAEKEIKKYQYHLEDLIKERTSELKETNRLLQAEIVERIRVEKALRTSEERFHSLFNLASDAILLLDADTEGRAPVIVDANVATCVMHGYALEELLGKPVNFLNAPESFEKSREASKQLKENPGEVVTFEISHIRKDGSVFPIEVSAKTINLDGKNYILGIDRDISLRKNAEESLKRSQQRFRAVFDNAPVGISITGTDRRFMDANAAFQRMTGYDISELSGMSVQDISHPEDDRLTLLYYEELMTGRLPHFSMEKRFIKKDGTFLISNIVVTTIRDNDEKPVLLFGIVEDITEKKKAEDELRKYHERLEEIIARRTSELLKSNKSLKSEISERKEVENTLKESKAKLSMLYNEFNIILNSTPDSIVLMSLDKKVLWANKSTESYADISAGNHIGKYCYELVHKKDCPVEECYADKVFGTKAPVDFQAKNYQGKMLDVRIVPIKDESGKIAKLLHIARDVTEKNRLHETAHLASLGEMAAAVAHEINNPNNVIMFNSSILRDAWGDAGKILDEYSREHGDFSAGGLTSGNINETVKNLIEGIAKSSVRIKNIVGDMRRLSLQDRQVFFEDYDLNTVVENAISLLNIRIQKHTKRFSFSATPVIPLLKGNPAQIEQVAINLILNALQALADNNNAVKVSTCYEASSACAILEVLDEGCGIDPAHFDQIMKPFFTTKHEGTGLGLSLAGKILATHNGKIEFSSNPGKGTKVKVTLPVRKPDRKEVRE